MPATALDDSPRCELELEARLEDRLEGLELEERLDDVDVVNETDDQGDIILGLANEADVNAGGPAAISALISVVLYDGECRDGDGDAVFDLESTEFRGPEGPFDGVLDGGLETEEFERIAEPDGLGDGVMTAETIDIIV
ncbi:MAG: hypothetical protein Q9157_002907 [Trypethelium eluteriae]